MVKVLNREGIQRMVGRGTGSVGSGGSSEGGGGISLAQVDAAYVSKAFFDQLFTVHGKRTYTDPETQEEVTEDVIISPNQIAEGEYSLSNVEVSVGLWTQQFLSALGLNSGGGGGGGGATALSELVDVALSNPQNGQALVYNSSTGKWVNGTVTPDLTDYATKSWVQQQGYITSSALTGYATQQWVQQQNYLTSHQSVDGTFWGQSWTNHGTVKGSIEAGRNGGAISGFHSIELNNYGTLSGYGGFIDFHYNGSSSDYTSRIIEDASGRLFFDTSVGVRIGSVVLSWDSGNNALKIQNIDGTAANFYATGGVSALGMSAGVSQMDAMTFNYVTINNNLEFGAASRITHAVTNDDRTLYIGNSDNSGWVALQDVCSQRGESYWKIMANGEALFAEKVQSPKFYLDSTRYIYVNGGTLYYYNGSQSKTIVLS